MSNPGSYPSSDPGSNPGLDPSSDPGSDPSSDPGSIPGSDPGFILSLSQYTSNRLICLLFLRMSYFKWIHF